MFCFDPTINWSTIIQLVGFIVAIGVAIYQFTKQRQLQKEKHKIDLQFQVYEKITTNIEISSPTGVATSFYMLFLALENARDKLDKTGKYFSPPFHSEDLNSEFRRVHANLWKVAAILEKYEIIVPHLPLFRQALAKKLRELNDAYIPLIQILPYVLLSEKGINNTENLIVLRNEDSIAFKEKVNTFSDIAYDLAGFLYDIQVELQNALLSPFFNRELPVRNPNDKETIVLTSRNKMMIQKAEQYVKE
ncbi:hypothetical protein [Nitrosomonas ureae]|uniref:Uncharacterized protein n=1 Tax=Nitrosomonas ureae TaxID=44577 RepID=A0A1H5UMZ6_9PROT|nr:hypothetical protein [Nitrosomonas ureae]SEF76439.1 hypothetical protein SAMN05216334_10897 [Nitrosomonas ureae]